MKALTKCPKCMGDLRVASEGNADMSEWEKRRRARPKFKERQLAARSATTVLPRDQGRVEYVRWCKVVCPSRYRVQLQCKRDTCRKVFSWHGRSKATVLCDMRKDLRRRHEERKAAGVK